MRETRSERRAAARKLRAVAAVKAGRSPGWRWCAARRRDRKVARLARGLLAAIREDYFVWERIKYSSMIGKLRPEDVARLRRRRVHLLTASEQMSLLGFIWEPAAPPRREARRPGEPRRKLFGRRPPPQPRVSAGLPTWRNFWGEEI